MTTKPLKIYKASAGSGKTYTLVREYLRLLLKTGDVYRFKRIIAMTFTNKAALEMKERVIKTLNQLAKQEEKDWKLVQNYAAEFQMNPDELSEKAGKALSSMLHNYSDLNIQTIDKFNVRLIRSFVRDLNMSNDFEVLVDTSEFNEKVVDKFLDSVHSRDREEIKNRLVSDYLEAKLERGEAWDIRGELTETLKLFEKETFRVLLPKLLEYDFNFENLNRFKSELQEIEEKFEESKLVLLNFLKNTSKEVFKDEFNTKYSGNVYDRLSKLSQQNILNFGVFSNSNLKAIDEFYEKTSSGNFYENFKKIHTFVDYVENQLKDEYLSYHFAVSSYFQLALLKYLIGQIEIQKLSENIIPLVEINDLISNQMRQENADYIYERVGVRFDHFLLDEFQDTSRMQWLNLIPLLHNSVAQNQMNLIVGDSKQAIYRFRNGVVEQFAKLPSLYNPERKTEHARLSAYFEENSLLNTLKDNWRSRKEIIEFNNQLFQNLRNILTDDFQQYYADEDLIQRVVNQNQGYVYVEIEPVSSSGDETTLYLEQDSEEDFEEEIDSDEAFLLERIKDVLSRGFQPKDICVLSRNNKDLGKWAKLLISKGYDVTTDEGLAVSNSVRVKFLVAWMQLILKPGSAQYQRNFVLNFMLLDSNKKHDDFLKYFKRSHIDFSSFLEEHFEGFLIYQMRYENLYDLVLKMLRHIGLDELSDPFLHFFCNLVQQFDIKFGPNIDRFLHNFNTRGKDKRIPLAEGNAIRLMTAHKSKGLEFHVVIMPKTAWDWNLKLNTHLFYDEQKSLFYMANLKTFNTTDLQRKLAEVEIEKNKLDTFNLFYVACTRAVDELHIRVGYKLSAENEKTKSSKALGYYLDTYFEKTFEKIDTKLKNKRIYTFGKPVQYESSLTKSENLNIHLHGETLWFPEISLIDRDSLEDLHINEERIFGRLVHQVLENMQNKFDLDHALENISNKSGLSATIRQKIQQHILAICQNNFIASLIFPNVELNEHTLDEREIVLSAFERIRPDRVIVEGKNIRVIEYKTGVQRPKDVKQLEQYVFALREMGFENCSSYLIYTDAMLVKQVC